MRRLLTSLGVAAGALLVFRGLFRRRKKTPAAEGAADPAEELKRKLAESRTDEDAPEQEPETARPSLDERRRAVHDKARAAIDDMLGGEQLPGEEPH
jgi:hypothetical protein